MTLITYGHLINSFDEIIDNNQHYYQELNNIIVEIFNQEHYKVTIEDFLNSDRLNLIGLYYWYEHNDIKTARIYFMASASLNNSYALLNLAQSYMFIEHNNSDLNIDLDESDISELDLIDCDIEYWKMNYIKKDKKYIRIYGNFMITFKYKKEVLTQLQKYIDLMVYLK